MNKKQVVDLCIEKAHRAQAASNKEIWVTCAMAARVVGRYEYGATLTMAARLSVEVDTVEDYSHAYAIFQELCNAHAGLYRSVVFAARRSGYIFYSHFRVLYEAREKYHLSLDEVFQYLMDVIQAEGDLSSRRLEKNMKEKHDKELDWTFYGKTAMKAIHNTLSCPDLPANVREVLVPAYEVLGDQA